MIGILVAHEYEPIYEGFEITDHHQVATANYIGAGLYALTSILCFARYFYLRWKENRVLHI